MADVCSPSVGTEKAMVVFQCVPDSHQGKWGILLSHSTSSELLLLLSPALTFLTLLCASCWPDNSPTFHASEPGDPWGSSHVNSPKTWGPASGQHSGAFSYPEPPLQPHLLGATL